MYAHPHPIRVASLLSPFPDPDLSTVSALQCAISVYIRFAGILNNGFELPTTWRWEGGTGVFVEALVNRLRQLGSGRVEIITNSPVLRIAQPELNKAVHEQYPVEVPWSESVASNGYLINCRAGHGPF